MRQGGSCGAARLGAISLLAAALLAGCDSGSDHDSGASATATQTATESTKAEAPARVKESGDPLPKLKRGWEVVRSRSGGFALARPPGWEPKRSRSSLTVLAPDRLVALSVSADRTAEGLAIAPGAYATRTAKSLPGYAKAPRPSPARPFRHRYRGSQVVARARASNGVPQELRVVVLRRPGLVTFTAVIARNARRHDAGEVHDAEEIVRTIRSRPTHVKTAGGQASSPGKGSKEPEK